jgi:hypothetical protein
VADAAAAAAADRGEKEGGEAEGGAAVVRITLGGQPIEHWEELMCPRPSLSVVLDAAERPRGERVAKDMYAHLQDQDHTPAQAPETRRGKLDEATVQRWRAFVEEGLKTLERAGPKGQKEAEPVVKGGSRKKTPTPASLRELVDGITAILKVRGPPVTSRHVTSR